jgi:hypothetical protein
MLINCGVIMGTPDANAVMQLVVQDVVAATGGQLEVVVATELHWDKISGLSKPGMNSTR